MTDTLTVHGVVFLLVNRDGGILLEQCPKKAAVLGYPGAWFVPGGKLEAGETPEDALRREMTEELGAVPVAFHRLPILEGSAVPPGPRGIFLMRPYVVTLWTAVTWPHDFALGTLDEATPLDWFTREQCLQSPVPHVRMMVAGISPFHPSFVDAHE